MGVEIEHRYRPSETAGLRYLHLAHTLATNDVLIAAELLCLRSTRLRLAGMKHDRTLQRDPVYVPDERGKRRAVVPDGWIDLHIDGTSRMCVAFEVDRGTRERRSFQEKLRRLVAYANGPYQDRFGTESLTIAFVAAAGEARMTQLLRWTEAELQRVRSSRADLFYFSTGPRDGDSPESFFRGSRWLRPFKQEPVPLLAGLN